MRYQFYCNGHPNVISTHKTTLEFTTESDLSLRGDCILGVKTTCSLENLPKEIKNKLRVKSNIIKIFLEIDNLNEMITGNGHPDLSLTSKEALIIRKSSYICPRTLMINSDKAACDLPKEIINAMKFHSSLMKVTIQVD